SRSGPSVPGAIVLGGDSGALDIARSLGRRRIPVWILSGPFCLTSFSRYAARRLAWPILRTAQEQADYLVALAREHHLEGWVPMATDDEGARLIARFRDSLAQVFNVVSASPETLGTAIDKRCLYEFADRLGLSYPRTFYPRAEADLAALTGSLPLIIKPS